MEVPRRQVEFMEVSQQELNRDSSDEDVGFVHPKENRFTVSREAVIWASVVFYIADLALDFWVLSCYFKAGKDRVAWFIFFCFLMPNLYAGYKSLQWYLRAHALEPRRTPGLWLIRLLFFPVSPLLRYWDAWRYGKRSREAFKRGDRKSEMENFENYLVESAEVSMLRLFIIFLEDAPIAVTNLESLVRLPISEWEMSLNKKPDAESMKIGVVVVKLFCTMTLGVLHSMSTNKMAWHLAHSSHSYIVGISKPERKKIHEWAEKGYLTWPAEVTAYCWQLLSIGSRLIAYALFGVVYFGFLWLIIILRWTIHSVWIYCDVKEMAFVNAIAFGGVYLFSFVSTSPGQQILRITLYYVITIAEDIIIAILWINSAPDDIYDSFGGGFVGLLFGGAFGGMAFMCLYYGFFHPEKDETWLRIWFREKQVGRKARIFSSLR